MILSRERMILSRNLSGGTKFYWSRCSHWMARDPTVPAQVYSSNNLQTGRHLHQLYTKFAARRRALRGRLHSAK
jgi:hypothetical protein